MICPWFGDEPEWADRWHENIERLSLHGYDFLHERDLDAFKRRVRLTLGVDCPITSGSAKIHDFRPVLGDLYRDELQGYDFWGHTDYDCVYGRVERFFTDDLLAGSEIVTDNSFDYLCGPWTLYRNNYDIRTLYLRDWRWRDRLQSPITSGWVEQRFSEIAQAETTVYIERFHRHNEPARLAWDGERLLWKGEEISFFHFRYTKAWPTIRDEA